MDHLARFLPSLSNVFDHSSKAAAETAESTTKTKPEPIDKKAEILPEKVPLVETRQSHENLAFEEEYLTKPQDTSVESSGSEKIDKELEGDDSGIADSDMDGKDISCVQETSPVETKEEKEPANRDYQPVLKSIGTFAMQFMVASAPEIKVEKPKTLAAVAATEENGENRPPTSARQPSRRHTEHDIIETKAKDSLAPEMATATRRRHSDFAVSAPRPINEELAEKDLKKHGEAKKTTKDDDKVDAKQARKGSQSPDIIRATRGPQWSPRLERKRREEELDGTHKQERRKTLAEIAKEAGYPSSTDGAADMTEVLPMPKTAEPNLKGSNESLLGEHEDEHYSGIRVTGEIFVSLRYEMKSKKFEVHIHSANNLAAADAKKSSSDPYVKSYLLPDRRSKRKTKTKKDTLNPVFDEILEYFIGYDELLTRTLFLSVWHKLIGRNEFLGEVKINMNAFLEAGYSLQEPTAKWFTLTEKSDITDCLPSSPPELVLALKYVTADKVKKKGRHKGELHVHLLEARNLPGMDADGMSDPYCKCFLLPDRKGRSKHKTPVVKRTLNPSFDYKFSCDEVSLDDLKERALEIAIWDFDRASSDEFLGGVRLGLGTSSNDWDDATEDESQIWHTMLSRSNVWIQVVVPLRSSMISKKKNASKLAQ